MLGFWSQVTVVAQVETENTTRVALRGMQSSLQQVAVTPHHLTKNEAAGLQAVLGEAKQHLSRLAAAFDADEAPIAYLEDLMAVSLRLSQLAMRSSFARADLAVLRELEKDLRAKRLCAERHPSAPGEAQRVDFVVSRAAGVAAPSTAFVVCVQKITGSGEQGPTALPGAVAGQTSATLMPGLYRVWNATADGPREASTAKELVVDGGRTVVELPGG